MPRVHGFLSMPAKPVVATAPAEELEADEALSSEAALVMRLGLAVESSVPKSLPLEAAAPETLSCHSMTAEAWSLYIALVMTLLLDVL